ncbi:MAG: LCP family protein [Erysipelotrichaceae bacterium]
MSKQKKRKINKRFKNLIILAILLIIAILLLYFVNSSAILPALYKIIGSISVILLVLLALYLLPKKKTTPFLKFTKNSLVYLIITSLAVVTFLLPQIETKIKMLQVEQPSNTDVVVSVIALNDTEFTNVNDFLDNEIAIQTNYDQEHQEYAINYLNSEVKGNVLIKNYPDFETALADLKQGNIKFLLINESYINIMKENANYTELLTKKTKIVYQTTQSVAYNNIQSDISVTENSFNILILGQNQEGVSVSDNLLTDVIMIASINPITKKIHLTSIPRDSYVSVPYDSEKDKITHVGVHGTSEMIETLEGLLEIKLDFFIRINYNSLIKIIDALGGISVNNQYKFSGVFPTYDYVFEVGELHLDGDMALAYARERKDTPEGDISRNEHQRMVLSAIIDKVTSPSILVNFNQIFEAVEGTYLTNITSNQIFSLLKMQLADLASWELSSNGLTGELDMLPVASTSDLASVVILDESNLNLAQQLINDTLNSSSDE